MRIGDVRHGERAGFGKPLTGVRVLAVEQMQALPYATQLLAHLGADVVKVEHPERGDTGRASTPSLTDADGRRVGATFLRNNLGKRSLGLDLKSEAGRSLFRRLVPHFDVVAENLKPGAMDRLGLGYEAIAAIEPRAIVLAISGFGKGDASPYADWPAYAPVAEAMAGLYEPTRKPGEPPPVVVAGALGDIASALFAVIGILSALRHRDRTGLGQLVDIALYDAMVAVSDMPPFLWSMGAPPQLATAGTTGLCAAFRARDGHFVVAVFREHHFARLATAVGHPEWCDDPRFATREGWATHTESVIRPAIEAWAEALDKREACARLCAEGIAAGPSHRPEDLASDPHVAMRDMLLEVPRPDGQRPMLVVGNPVKLSRMAEGPLRSFPRLGGDSADVLRELLDLGDDELRALRDQGVVS